MSGTRALGMVLLLASVSRSDGIKTDVDGDPLPPGAVARLGTVRLRHRDAQVAFSKDGKRLISCGRNGGEVRVWDVATGKRLRSNRLPVEADPFHHVTLSPDGSIAAIRVAEVVRLWDTVAGKEIGRIPSITGLNHSVTFSPHGRLLAIQTSEEEGDSTTQIWDVAAVKKRQSWKTPRGVWLPKTAFSDDGKQLAQMIDTESEKGKNHLYYIHLFLHDTATGKLIGKKKRELSDPTADSLALSPDGKLLAVAAGFEDGVLLFEAPALKEKARLKPPADDSSYDFDDLAFSSDGRHLAAVSSRFRADKPIEFGVFVWDLKDTKKAQRLPGRLGAELIFSPDGRTLACYHRAGEIRLWDSATGRPLHRLPGHDDSISALAVSPDGKMIASHDLGSPLRIWDAATSRQLRSMESSYHLLCEWPVHCSFSPDGKSVISGSNGSLHESPWNRLRVWEVATGKMLRQIGDGKLQEVVDTAAISADGRSLSAVSLGSDPPTLGRIVWDLATGRQRSECEYRFDLPRNPKVDRHSEPRFPLHAALTPDGEITIVWLGDRLGLAEVSTGCLLSELPKGVGTPVRFSPDGRLLAAAIRQPRNDPKQDDVIRGIALIEAASGQEIFRLTPERYHWTFTTDGRSLIEMDENHLRVWDADTGAKLYQMAWPKELGEFGFSVYSPLAALPGGRVATGMEDGNILVWDLAPATWPKPKLMRALDRKRIDLLWADLTKDARSAHRAIHALAAAPAQVVPYLRDHLQPVLGDGKGVEKLLTDLDGDSFPAREAASKELARLHYRIEPILRRTLQSKPSLEMRRRIERILSGPKLPLADDLRMLRAIAVLERIGSPEARAVLEKLSKGAPSRATHEAQAALQRLKRR